MPAKTSLGLYFTDNFIEVSQVSADGTKLERFSQITLPAGLVQNSEIKNGEQFIQVLQKLFAMAKPYGISLNEDVVIGVNDNRVFLREFVVPNIQGKNIDDAIEYQVRALLPVMPTGVQTDWQIIGKDAEGNIEVLLAAVPRQIIESYVAVCTTAGLRVVAVEPAVFANIRVINQAQLLGRNQLLIYLSDSFGIFSYITSGNPRFSDFLSQQEIEKNGGLAKTIQAYINYANSKHPTRPVLEIVISGSRQDIDNFVPTLKTENIPAVKAISRLARTEVLNHTLLHTAHGLSLKTLDASVSINVLPLEFRLAVIKSRLSRTWKTILSLLILFTVAGIGGLYFLYHNVLNKKTILLSQKNHYEELLNRADSQGLIKQTNDLNKITTQLVTLRSVTGGEESVLRELAAITPTGVTLTSMVMTRDPGAKKLVDAKSSWIMTGNANSRPLVLNFYNNLIKNPDFSTGKLYFGSLEKDIGLTFRIASQLTP